jgi:DegV family protein with EDD domain
MKRVAIITDSSSGIINGQYPDVYVLPLIITETTNNTTTTYRDGIDLDAKKLADLISRGADLKTSQANVSEMMQLAEKLSNEYDQVFVIPIPPTLSSNYNSWNVIVDDFPKMKIFKQFMVGRLLEWTISDLVEKNKEGLLTTEYVTTYLDDVNKLRGGVLIVSDMTQLKKGGRVRGVKSLVIKLLRLSILISFDYDGLSFANVARKPEEIVKKIKEIFNKKIDLKSREIKRALVFKNDGVNLDKDKSEIEGLIQAQFSGIKFEIAPLPSVILAHTGIDYIAFGFDLKK